MLSLFPVFLSLFLCFSLSPFNTCSYVMISLRAKIVAMDEKLETKSFDSFSLMRWIIADFPLFCPSLSGGGDGMPFCPTKDDNNTHTHTHTHTHKQTSKYLPVDFVFLNDQFNSIGFDRYFSCCCCCGEEEEEWEGTYSTICFRKKSKCTHRAGTMHWFIKKKWQIFSVSFSILCF